MSEHVARGVVVVTDVDRLIAVPAVAEPACRCSGLSSERH